MGDDKIEIVERLHGVAVSIGMEWTAEHRQHVFDTVKEAALTIESLVKALEIAEGVLSNVPYDFATTNGGRIPVTKASEARDIARAEITKLRGGEHEGR